ncbi:MAG: S1 RNA-binding domain-containing protein, partial [Firmicutes bacterium]|nr:S1 RNA-binding domain-containing protein [Bacillota bacterium]
GGLNSSNTKNLYEVAKTNCKNVFWISDTDNFDYKKIGKCKKVAILAGASTPIEEILEVKHNMEEVTHVEGQTPSIEETEEKMSMEQVLKQINSGQKKYARGQEIKTTIVLANDEGLMLQIGAKKGEVLLPKNEINLDGSYDKSAFCSGDEIEVLITEVSPLTVSRKKLLENRIEEEQSIGIEENSVFKVTISGFNKGGLVGKVGAANIFVPSSQIRLGFVKAEELERYVNKELKVKAIKIEGKKVVASQRAVIEEERAAKDAEKQEIAETFFGKLELDQIVNGKVVRFADFGAFVNVDGFDCLAHVSDLSYKPGIKAEEILEKGNNYDFKVLKIDKEKQQVSLGYKQLQKRPWEIAAEKYPVNSVLKGKVVRLTNFGAFIEIEPGFDGLVHVSQISNEWIENPTQVLAVGQEVDVLVLDVNPEAEKLTLSIKALLPPVEKPEEKVEEKVKTETREKMRGNSRDNNKDSKERPRRRENSDEPREWISGDNGGASIGELLKDFKFE